MSTAATILIIFIIIRTVSQVSCDGRACVVNGRYAILRCIILLGLLWWGGFFRL
jgi:hypothetical protein